MINNIHVPSIMNHMNLKKACDFFVLELAGSSKYTISTLYGGDVNSKPFSYAIPC